MEKRLKGTEFKTINYINICKDNLKFNININWKARLIHLENCFTDDIEKILKNPNISQKKY